MFSLKTTLIIFVFELNSFSRNADYTFDSLTSRYQEIYRSKARIQEWDDELSDISGQIKGKENMKQYEIELIDVTAQALLNIGLSNFKIRINDRQLLRKTLLSLGFSICIKASSTFSKTVKLSIILSMATILHSI